MNATSFHFAFPDRVLHYDCARCTALCCRGYGLAAHDRELVQLLRRAPQLASWATTRNQKIVHFQNPTGYCYFLDKSDRCSIEQDHGRAQKPSLCKAFPFNSIVSLGATRIVSPHLLCPLQLELPQSERNTGDHARIAAELEQGGWLDQDFPELVLDAGESPAAFLESERAFCAACADALGDGADGTNTVLADLTAELTDVVELLQWQLPAVPTFAPWFYALAPSWSIEHSHLPAALRRRALALAGLHLTQAFNLEGTRSSLQVCHRFWNTNVPLYELLAQFDRPMSAGLLVDTGHAATLLAAAVIDQMAKRGATVLQALQEGCADLAALDRQTLVNALATMQHTQRKRARQAQKAAVPSRSGARPGAGA